MGHMFGSIFGVIIFFFLLILLAVSLFVPFFILRIRDESIETNIKLDRIIKLLEHQDEA
jgi:hypothetical protein